MPQEARDAWRYATNPAPGYHPRPSRDAPVVGDHGVGGVPGWVGPFTFVGGLVVTTLAGVSWLVENLGPVIVMVPI